MGGERSGKKRNVKQKRLSEADIISRLKLLHLDIARYLQIKQINTS